VIDAVGRAESLLEERGRVLLRASGTEPLVRVMVEGEDLGEVERVAGDLADQVRAATRS
jgi:phosphoglucosamine mutase